MKLNVSDVAALLAVTEETVYDWIRGGMIPFTWVNEQHRLNRTDVLEWAVASGHRLSMDVLRRTAGDPAASELAPALQCGGVHRLDGSAQRSELLRALVMDCRDLEEGDRTVLLDLLLASEALGPIGLGNGIAIPRVRAPIVVQGAKASIATWYLDVPVDFFGAPDGAPVDTVFFIVTPTPRAHLDLVSQLMIALQDVAFRETVRGRALLEPLVAAARRVEGERRP